MVKCRDIAKMNLDGMWLLAGKAGLDRVVSWTYVVLTRPFDDHMNHGNLIAMAKAKNAVDNG